MTTEIKLIDMLSRSQGVCASDAEEEGIGRRAFYRALNRLRDDFPLLDERRGHKVYWMLQEDYVKKLPNISLPDLVLTNREILLLTLLLNLQNPLGDSGFKKVKKGLLKKLALLESRKPVESRSLNTLSPFVTPLNTGLKTYRGSEKILSDLFKAIESRRVCKGSYHAYSSDRMLDFEFHPLKIYEWNQGLYVFCLLEPELPKRNLAIERFKSLTLTSRSFELPDFDPNDLMKQAFAITWDDPVHVRIHFTKDAALYVKARTWSEDQSFEDLEDGSIILNMNTSGRDDVFRWVLGFGSRAEVLEPKDLALRVRDEFEKGFDRYGPRIEKDEVNLARIELEKEALDEIMNRRILIRYNEHHPDKDYKLPRLPIIWQENLVCTVEERKALRPLIDLFFRMLKTARSIGLLGIDEEYDWESWSPLFFTEALEKVLDGYRANKLENILTKQIDESDWEGRDLLEAILILHGCLCLVKGSNPLEAMNHLESILAE